MRHQPRVKEAYIRMLKIPIVGAITTFCLSYPIFGDYVVSIWASFTIAALFYIPLFGLLYFETLNWIEIHEDGLKMYIDNDESFLKWDEIDNVRISGDSLIITSLIDDQKRCISYLSTEAKDEIYKTYFEIVGFRPNRSGFYNKQSDYLNWS